MNEEEQRKFRKMVKYDLIVIGGGPAGVGAAYAGAKAGAKVLLLERYGRLGGMATQAMVSPISGGNDSRYVKEILQVLGGNHVDFSAIDLLLFDLLEKAGAEILLYADVLEPLLEGNRVTGAKVNCREGVREFFAETFLDATGDGTFAARAGVPFEIGRQEDHLTQPMSIMYTVSGIEKEKIFLCGSEEEARKKMIGGTTWERCVLAGRERGELPPEVGIIRTYASRQPGSVFINATQVNRLNALSSPDLTRAEIVCRKQAFRILEFMKKHLPGHENAWISAMPALIGIRETRRLEGIRRLEKADCLAGERIPDAVVRFCNFPIDIHNPDGIGQAKGHESDATGTAERIKPYDIPYGVMLPRRVEGLLFAGRCISASHEALASCRVMGIAMALGGAAGRAAAEAVKRHIPLREVDPGALAADLFQKN